MRALLRLSIRCKGRQQVGQHLFLGVAFIFSLTSAPAHGKLRSVHNRSVTMPIQLTCQNCGNHFMVKPRDGGRKFCTKACTTAYEQRHGRIAARVASLTFTCKQCGNLFQMKQAIAAEVRRKWNRDPIYCSMPCSDLGRKADADAKTRATLKCIQCGNPITEVRKPSGYLRRNRVLCSTECRSAFRRLNYQAKATNLEPRRRMYKNGYWRVYIPGKDGEPPRELFEHRYVMEQHLGRELLPGETVHHIDGDRGNNALTNLQLFKSRHGPGQRVSDLVAEAVEILRQYPEEFHKRGFTLEEIDAVLGTSDEGDTLKHAPFSTPP